MSEQSTPAVGESNQLPTSLTYKVAVKTRYGEPGDCGIVDATGCFVAETFRRVSWEDYRDAEALARLFCAAPDLLTACEAALTELRCEGVAQMVGQGIFIELKQAIAKARGQRS